MQGKWQGYYKFDKAWVQRAIGFEKTGFTIDIILFDGKGFEGVVEDDLATGGMEGNGDVKGVIKDDRISFTKHMYEGSEIYPDGTHRKTGKKHRTLYYSGKKISANAYSGQWHFKIGIGFLFGMIPYPHRAGKGTWLMEKV
ncbi:MAG: hypothetical protein ACO1N9_01435 [Flavobacterium sp.]